MDIKHQVGVRIRVFRKQRGLTQEGLAARIDRSVETISNLECGRSLPSFETLVRLAESLDVPIRDFFEFGEDVAQSDAYRLELLTTLTEIARRLETRDLAVAVEQIKALAVRGAGARR